MSIVPPVVRATSESKGRQRPLVPTWVLSLGLFALLVTLILLFSYAAACFDEQFKAGDWLDLRAAMFMIVIFPPLGVCCCVLALILLRRRAHRGFAVCALVIALLLGFPLTALLLARGLSAPAAYVWQPYKDAADKAELERRPRITKVQDQWTDAIVRHYDTLTAQFARPQRIARAEDGMILLDDHKIVRLYGVYYSHETNVDFTTYVNQNLLNKHAVIRLPNRESFMKSYSPGPVGDPHPDFKPEFFVLSPKDAFNWHYGTIPCLVYVDGHLLNSRYKRTGGSLPDFSEYEMQPGSPAASGPPGGRN